MQNHPFGAAAEALIRLLRLTSKLSGSLEPTPLNKDYIRQVATNSTRLLSCYRRKSEHSVADNWIIRLGGADVSAELASFIKGYTAKQISAFLITPNGCKEIALRDAMAMSSMDTCIVEPTGKIKYRGVVLAEMTVHTIWSCQGKKTYEVNFESKYKMNYLSVDRLLDLKMIGQKAIAANAASHGDKPDLSKCSTILFNGESLDDKIEQAAQEDLQLLSVA